MSRRKVSPLRVPELFEDLKQHPQLPHDEQAAMGAKMNDESLSLAERDAARNRLIEGNLKLAIWVASGYQGRGVPLEDLIAECFLELHRVARDWNPAISRFTTYATRPLHWACRKAVQDRNLIHVPPTARHGGGHVAEAEAASKVMVGINIHGRFEASGTGTVSPDKLAQFSYSYEYDNAEAAEESARLAEVKKAMQGLLPRDREVLERRMNGQILDEIAIDLKVCRERVRQIEFRAIERIRDALAVDEQFKARITWVKRTSTGKGKSRVKAKGIRAASA